MQRPAVIIPYYQRNPGLLRRAVQSVLSQDARAAARVIVVDDGSPVPAAQELAGLSARVRSCIEIVRQRNGGPARARNAGLDLALRDSTCVLFLDSDDCWLPGHLGRALEALEVGAHAYFADTRYLDRDQSVFATKAFDREQGAPVSPAAEVRWLTESLFDLVLGARIVTHLSATAYRAAAYPELRFDASLALGEDLTFWLDLASRGARCAYSPALSCLRDAGGAGPVGVYESASWGSPRALWCAKEELRFRKRIAARYRLSAEQRRENDCILDRLRAQIARIVMHQARRGTLDLKALADTVRIEPSALMWGPLRALDVVLRRRGGVSADAR